MDGVLRQPIAGKGDLMRRMLLIALALAIPTALAAQDEYPPPPEIILQQVLGLDASQVSSIQKLVQARQSAVEPLVQQIQKQSQTLAETLNSSSPDPAAVGKL